MDGCIGVKSPLQRGLVARCERGHEQRIYTPDHEEITARTLAGLMDGTSPFYVVKPRDVEVPGSVLGRCQHDETPASETPRGRGRCGAWVTCALFGYAARAREADHV